MSITVKQLKELLDPLPDDVTFGLIDYVDTIEKNKNNEDDYIVSVFPLEQNHFVHMESQKVLLLVPDVIDTEESNDQERID